MSSRRGALLAASLSLSLVVTSSARAGQPEAELAADAEAAAEPEPAPEPEEPAEDPEVTEAKQLFLDGVDRFDTADYAGAIELWTRAYGLVPNTPDNASVKAKLIANIAAAQERAYAVDGEVSHLNQAKILLQGYREAIPDIYPASGPDAIDREKELAWVEQRLGAIATELEAVAEREAAEREAAARAKQKPGRGLIIGGSVLVGLGVGGLGVMTTGMVLGGRNNAIADLPTTDLDTRADRFAEGRLGNTLAIAGAAGGAVLVGAGVALLVVGLKKKRAHSLEGAAARLDRVPQLVPQLGRSSAGLGLVGRF